ncbi:L,D-transpeptidase family protein [Peteryoungia desertarenae]|uniref:L,D-transpeptidase family protein n=1 Tax=Peteryoungia desertarenae TaxID=1813451 RepID=UPI001FE8CDCF|nr:L,D-transpeptidase family protein [Peteryoungia desertarenae]
MHKTQAILQFGPLRLRAAIGRSGITSFKREGDGATPRASMPLMSGYLRGDRLRTGIRTSLPMKRLKSGMLWCDEPSHAAYNRPVAAPFSAGHEKLCRTDELYNLCIVLDWNITSRSRGRGSAIFFHVARPGFTPTEGCIAPSQRDLARILPYMRAGTRFTVL